MGRILVALATALTLAACFPKGYTEKAKRCSRVKAGMDQAQVDAIMGEPQVSGVPKDGLFLQYYHLGGDIAPIVVTFRMSEGTWKVERSFCGSL
jgi:hypothetical protein